MPGLSHIFLLNLAGHEAIERARSFEYADGESNEDPEVLKAKFKELCEPKENITIYYISSILVIKSRVKTFSHF